MFKVNDYVRYGMKGVFQIKEIQKRRDKNNKKSDWYVLYANSDGVETKIITPASNPTLRKVLNKEEAISLLKMMHEMEIDWEPNKRTRDEYYAEVIKSGDMVEMAKLMKSIYFVRMDKLKEGKDISQKDRELYENAEKLLFEELSISLNIQRNEVLEYILNTVPAE